MLMRIDTKIWHTAYEQASERDRANIDAAVYSMLGEFADQGYRTPRDDRAEELVAAVTRYLLTANR